MVLHENVHTHQLLIVLRVSTFTDSACHFMSVDRDPKQALHGTPWLLAVPRSTDTNVAEKNRYYTSEHHVSRTDQKLCSLETCREHHETRRDLVSCQTEGNSARVVECVLKVEGFNHKFVTRMMLASPLVCGRSHQSRMTFSLSGS